MVCSKLSVQHLTVTSENGPAIVSLVQKLSQERTDQCRVLATGCCDNVTEYIVEVSLTNSAILQHHDVVVVVVTQSQHMVCHVICCGGVEDTISGLFVLSVPLVNLQILTKRQRL